MAARARRAGCTGCATRARRARGATRIAVRHRSRVVGRRRAASETLRRTTIVVTDLVYLGCGAFRSTGLGCVRHRGRQLDDFEPSLDLTGARARWCGGRFARRDGDPHPAKALKLVVLVDAAGAVGLMKATQDVLAKRGFGHPGRRSGRCRGADLARIAGATRRQGVDELGWPTRSHEADLVGTRGDGVIVPGWVRRIRQTGGMAAPGFLAGGARIVRGTASGRPTRSGTPAASRRGATGRSGGARLRTTRPVPVRATDSG